jgi:hypothetical protein
MDVEIDILTGTFMPIIKNGNGSTQLSVTVLTSIDNENSPSSNNEKVRPGLID